MKFLDKKSHIDIFWDDLPHWQQVDCMQFVTFRTSDSMPKQKLDEYRSQKEELLLEDLKDDDDYILESIDYWLNQGCGKCVLKDSGARRIVEHYLHLYDEVLYDLYAYVIMPNHVHLLLSPSYDTRITESIGKIKQLSTYHINKMFGLKGNFWQKGMFDRILRGWMDYENKLNYIIYNPESVRVGWYSLWVKGRGYLDGR